MGKKMYDENVSTIHNTPLYCTSLCFLLRLSILIMLSRFPLCATVYCSVLLQNICVNVSTPTVHALHTYNTRLSVVWFVSSYKFQVSILAFCNVGKLKRQ